MVSELPSRTTLSVEVELPGKTSEATDKAPQTATLAPLIHIIKEPVDPSKMLTSNCIVCLSLLLQNAHAQASR
jgi:hypothetical protein